MQTDLPETHTRLEAAEEEIRRLWGVIKELRAALAAQEFIIQELNRSIKAVKRREY